MRTLLQLFCYLLVINNCLVCGQNDGGCSIDEIGKENIGQVYVLNIRDTQINTNVLSSTYNGSLDVQNCTGDTHSYFNVSNNETHFFIDSTAAFGDFDKNTPKTSSRVALVTLECTFVCTSSIKQIIQIQVNDTNNHDPEFHSTSYEFKVPTPIMPLTDFTVYGEAIVATDIDFSNQNVTFTIEPDDFSITTRSTSTSKDYTALFSSKRILQLTGSKSYTITATDSDSPTRHSNTTLTITVDTERSLDYPSFSAASYTFNYTATNDDGVPILKPNEDPIILTTIRGSSISTPTLNGEFSKNFKVSFNADTSTVDISITEALPATKEPFLILTLSVLTDNTASTSIIIYLSEESNETLHFSNHYYTGTYDDVSNHVVLDSNITVTSVKTPNVSLSGDFADHFNVRYDEKTAMCKLSIKSNLTATDLKGLSYITIQIKAQVDESYDTSAIILSLPIHALKFTEALYNASYSDNEVVIDENTPISFSKEVSGVSFVVDGSYSAYFDVKQDSGKNQYVISSSLPEDVLKEEREIVLTLTATDTYGNEAQTVVTIQLPQKKTAPKFTEEYYIGTYPTNGSGTIGLDKAISFTGENSGKIQIELKSYKENFAVSYNSGEWVVTVKDCLNKTVISENTELVIVLSATEDGSAEGHSILVIELPTPDDTESLKFEKPYYIAEYPKNGTGIIEFNDPIKLINVKNINAVSITAENYTENFDIKYESNRWYINIVQKIDESLLHNDPEIVMTLTAVESGNLNKGKSVLVLQIPQSSNDSAPIFSAAYYSAKYVIDDSQAIEFENPIEFTNADSSSVTIIVDQYSNNLEIQYNKKWYIHVKDPLDENLIKSNSEILLTLTATTSEYKNKGQAALFLKLPSQNATSSIRFKEAYYLADYPQKGSGSVDFYSPIEFYNVVDKSAVTITLDKYTENFDIVKDSTKWFLYVKIPLNDSILNDSELVMTLTASEKGIIGTDSSALVLKLPRTVSDTAPEFSETYYLADYPESGRGEISLKEPISLLNVDPATVNISLDKYTDHFEIIYPSNNTWAVKITTGIDNNTLANNTELVMTLIAHQKDNSKEGHSVLVLRLPSSSNSTTKSAPEFSKAYYIASYPSEGSGKITFEEPVSFENVAISSVTLNLDNYIENFELKLESEKWYINIVEGLNESVLNNNAELVMTLEATEKGNPNIGYSALVLKLPTAVIDSAPEFADAYYIGNYPESGKGTIELKNPIRFSKGDENAISVALDNYTDYFEINQTTDKNWIIKIKKSLENETMLSSNRELVMTMTATEADNKNQGYSALVIELPQPETKTSPEFSKTYYLADYPSKYTGVIEFTSPIKFENIDDFTQVTIQLSNYTDNFAIVQDDGKWKIKIKQNLDPSVLNSNAELVMSLVATASEMNSDGYATLVLRLPAKDDLAPIFSSSYYVANYKTTGSEATLVFEDPIIITNQQDISNISLTVENYKDNFMVEFDSKNNSWEVKVRKQLSDEILLAKTDLVLALTATNLDNSLTDHAAIDLYLPSLNTEKAPKFSKTYYTAKYTISGDSALVTFDNPLNITNKQNLKDISISLDNYIKNFFVTYNQSTGFWQMNVISNLDQSQLNAKDDLVMALTATEKNNDEIGQAALVMRLPVINNDEAPKFSSIYYYGTYITGDHPTITLETDIEIKNKNNLEAITINFDDSYKENLEIIYEDPKWVLKIKSPLDENIFKLHPDLILTLTATETDNLNVGQAALVLHLPVEETKLPPKFNLAHYSATYIIENNKAIIILNDTVTVVNKVDLSNISLSLDSFDDNFPFTFDPTNKRWTVSVQNPLLDEVVKSTTELVLTLTAKETDNENEGQSTLIISMPPLDINEDLVSFSEIHYSGNYSSEGAGSVKMNEKIIVATKNNTKIANVSIESENYADHFQLTQEGESYVVGVVTPLPTSVLETQSNLIMSLVAEVDDFKSYATLVINLPAIAVNTSTIRFTEALYTATYENVDGKGTLNVNGTIQVETEDDGNVEPNIFNSDGYDAYFQIDYSNKIITVTLKGDEDVPTEVLRNNAFIPLTLTIGIAGTTARASAVLNVEIKHENDDDNLNIEFSNVLYEGKYEVTNGTVSFIVDGAIEIVTNASDGIVAVNITNEYASYFLLSYSNKVVTVNLANSSLPSDVLASFSVIPLTMTAVIRETSYSSSAVLNVKIKYDNDSETDVIDFSSVLYTGEYSIVDDKGKLVVNDIINVVTNRPDGDITPTITDSDYRSYFHVSYSNKVVTVELIEKLPEEILERESLVALTLAVGIKDTALSSSAVLNIHINNDNTEDNRSIAFSNVLYNGKYEIVNNSPSLTIEDIISLVTNESDSNVVVTITNEFQSFFEIDYSKKTVTITLTIPLTEETLTTFTVVPLTLRAQINGTSHSASAVLNLEIKYDRDGDHDSIQFTSVLYNGLYSVKDKEHKFKVDDAINIITTATSNDVEAKISDDSPYRDHFSLSISENKVSIKLLKILPLDALKRNSFLALTLTAGIKETIHNSSAVLNIAIKNEDSNDNDDDDTKTELHHWKITFTVVTAILCVLLIACIAGAIAYYFLRLRNDSYSNLEEDGSGRVRFGKNSLTRSPSSKKSSALEERRPTGFIFHPIDDDMVENRESPTDADKGRRKSVAFDDNVEKMQIDSVNDDENDVSNNEKSQVTHV